MAIDAVEEVAIYARWRFIDHKVFQGSLYHPPARLGDTIARCRALLVPASSAATVAIPPNRAYTPAVGSLGPIKR